MCQVSVPESKSAKLWVQVLIRIYIFSQPVWIGTQHGAIHLNLELQLTFSSVPMWNSWMNFSIVGEYVSLEMYTQFRIDHYSIIMEIVCCKWPSRISGKKFLVPEYISMSHCTFSHITVFLWESEIFLSDLIL